MDLGLPPIGVNTGLVFIIVLLTQGIKKIDKSNKFKKFYILIPLLLGIGAAFLSTDPLAAKEVIINSIVYAGVAGYFYKSGKLAFGKKEKNGKNERKKENKSTD
jgi:hypothetical protein